MNDIARGVYPTFLTHPVELRDVEFAYRLLLGREVESLDVALPRVGQERSELILGLVSSDEFRDLVASTIGRGEHGTKSLTLAPSRELLLWVSAFFELDRTQQKQFLAAGNGVQLLRLTIGLDQLTAMLTRHLGSDEASRVIKRVYSFRHQDRSTQSRGPLATPEDISKLYQLILDREPESSDVVQNHQTQTVLGVATTFLISSEFAARMVQPAMANTDSQAVPISLDLAEWTAKLVGLPAEKVASVQQALAALIDLPVVRDAMDAASLSWDVDIFVSLLEQASIRRVEGDEPPAGSFAALLKESDLFDPAWYLTRYADIRRAGADPFDHFVHHGVFEGRDPGPRFDTAFYVEAYPDVLDSFFSPVEHYIHVGRGQGAATRGPGPFERWVGRFDELTDEDRRRIVAAASVPPLPSVLCLHVPGPNMPASSDAVRAALTYQLGTDPKIVLADGRAGLERAIDQVAALSDGSVVLLSAGDARLREHACFAFATTLAGGEADIAYCDHDMVDADGLRSKPMFKPVMSPDLMIRQPYAGPVVAVWVTAESRQRIIQAISEASTSSPNHAFARLILLFEHQRVARIPLTLFSILETVEDAAASFPDVFEPTGEGAREPELSTPERWPSVTILIPTRDRWVLVRDCIDSIFAETDYPLGLIQIVVVDNDSSEQESLDYLADLGRLENHVVVPSHGSFNFARICNDGAAAARGDVIIFLNNDTSVIEADWLKILVANAVRPEIGVVGTQLLYPDDTIQHGGVLLGLQGVGGHRLIGMPLEEARVRDVTRQMTSVTGACLAIRRTIFEEMDGFDTVLGVAFNDVDLCIRVVKAGYQNLYVARPLLYHHESKSRGFDDTRQKVDRNAREAIYVRARHDAFFRDDPSYSPNLSLQRDGEIAIPPRVMRPWRRDPEQRHVLILSVVHGIGHGVGCVVAKQAEAFVCRGWAVTIGGGTSTVDRDYPGCRRVKLTSPEEAAAFAVAEGMDCVIAHTPPFFSIARYLGQRPLFYAYDHGEPPTALFADTDARQDVDWEKRFCVPLAKRVFAISETIRDAQFRSDAIVLRNGNSHLASWSDEWADRRAALREKFGFEGKYVILNVCRFHEAERAYKGVDDYVTLAHEAPYAVPGLADEALFVLVGRGDPDDVAYVRKAGLTVFANVTDAEMAELYAASDLYVNLSHWEGYNLGIGQALAMGLDVVASDIPAHREFGIPIGTTQPRLCALVGEAFARRNAGDRDRAARVEHWDRPMAALVDLLEQDVAEDLAGPWI